MSLDTVCFGVYVDGVCAVGCNRQKEFAAVEAAKASLDAAGLQCSDVEADASRQVCTGLQLNHQTRLLSLEASRLGLEFAARQSLLTGDQVVKLIGYVTWSCLLRRSALSLINARYRFVRTFEPRNGRVWPVVAQEFRWVAALPPLLNCSPVSAWSPWVYVTDASGGLRRGYGVTRRQCDLKDVADAGWCAERWRLLLRTLLEPVVRFSWRVKGRRPKPFRLESKMLTNVVELTCTRLWWEACKQTFSHFLSFALPSTNVPSLIVQPKSAWKILFGGAWRKLLDILRERAKLTSWGCVMRVVFVKAWVRGFCSCWTMWLWCWALQRSVPALQSQPHLSRNLCRLACYFHHHRLQMDCIRMLTTKTHEHEHEDTGCKKSTTQPDSKNTYHIRNMTIKVIYKSGDPASPSHCRPKCSISILYKIFSQRLHPTMDANQSADQGGFRPGYTFIGAQPSTSKKPSTQWNTAAYGTL